MKPFLRGSNSNRFYPAGRFLEVKKLVDFCEKCKNFIKRNKLESAINGSKHYKTEYICKLGHRITKSKDGWIPRTHGYTCKDFNPK